jgi:hypothetical protein
MKGIAIEMFMTTTINPAFSLIFPSGHPIIPILPLEMQYHPNPL